MGSSDTLYYLTGRPRLHHGVTDEDGDVDTTWDHDVFGAVPLVVSPTTSLSPTRRWTTHYVLIVLVVL